MNLLPIRLYKGFSLLLAVSLAQADDMPLEAVTNPKVPAALLKSQDMPSTVETLEVRPGVNTLIPVAVGHLNRILLPFENPKIRTVNTATTEIHGRVLYVAPADEAPFSLYVTEGESEDVAVSLTLAPGATAPREIRLRLLGSGTGARRSSSHKPSGSPLERPQVSPVTGEARYLSRIKQLIRSAANGQTPDGFTLRTPEKPERIRCPQLPLNVSTGQVLDGGHVKILIGAVKNATPRPQELDEPVCRRTAPGTLAIAAWPRTHLAPGESTELYVLIQSAPPEVRSDRPRLIHVQQP